MVRLPWGGAFVSPRAQLVKQTPRIKQIILCKW